ncbi:MAG TPA: hypothetical protein VGF16_06495 [Bryobacteraceae bacterium]|jgi:hypothetical protein
MHALWSREFGLALLGFLVPTAIAAGFVYRRLLKSSRCRKGVERRVTEACAQYVLDTAEPVRVEVTVHAGAVTVQSIRQPLDNLRQRLVEFRGSIQQSVSALGQLQECDCRFSMDLGRASELMHRAFSK